MNINKIICGDSMEVLKTFPNESVHCCVTSPPYWGLRDYGVDGQLGLEKTPEEYVAKMVELFREVRRVLKNDGTLWLNLGDSYNGSGGDHKEGKKNDASFQGEYSVKCGGKGRNINTLKPKDLCGIPWMVAFALRADGWYLRQDIIWHKPNPMPESVTDRCTKAHEYIFLMSKSGKYYFDNEAIKEASVDDESYSGRRERNVPTMAKYDLKNFKKAGSIQDNGKLTSGQIYEKRNKRSVWTVTTKPFKEAHFATFPEALIRPCVLAGCPKDGVVLDPFSGAGTTALVAKKEGRNFIGIELNSKYVEMSENRINSIMF